VFEGQNVFTDSAKIASQQDDMNGGILREVTLD